MKRLVLLLTVGGFGLGAPLPPRAAPPAVTLRPVVTGLSEPVSVTHAGDSSARLFVAEQVGRVRIIQGAALLGTPFLDIRSRVLSGGERGLLGLAFHPLYAANRKFYVFYTRTGDGALQVSEFRVTGGDEDVADPGSERPLLTVPHPTFGNHNGGHLAFGPDGYLYIATGDGGSANDPSNNGQNRNVLLGKLLRIDVNTETGYLVPATNPFVGQDGADEVWAYGLRNPWKFSFDRMTGDLLIADVGQGAWEEVNFEPANGAGARNYGWRVMEGDHCFNPSSGCDRTGKVVPIIEYPHNSSGGFAIIGGYVYRGVRSAALRGYYLYGDWSTRHVWAAAAAEAWAPHLLLDAPSNILAFGEDQTGELYLAGANGTLYAIDGAGPALPIRGDFGGDGRADILWRNAASGENYVYPMNGRVIGPGEGFLRTVGDLDWKIAGVGDFDGDGKADILWRNQANGQNYLYFMDGTAIKPTEGPIRTVTDLGWTVAGVGDFDGDGKADILWRHLGTGMNYVYFMDGRTILGNEGYLRTVADHRWQVAGLGDLDGDGKADIVWRNTASGQNYAWLMDGISIKPNEGFLRTVTDQSWQVAGIGDFDGDGRDDLLWRNVFTGENYLYPMDGTAIRSTEGYLRTVSNLDWRIVAVGDYDGDGKSDVMWRNISSGENYVYAMDGKAIRPTEGHLRTVTDQSWRPRHTAPFAVRRGAVDGAQVPFDTSATGHATARMDLLSREVTARIDRTGLTGDYAAHIHVGARGVDGGIIVNFVQLVPGAWVQEPGATMPAARYLDFLGGATYVNIHTPARDAGEIRGQLE